MREKERRLGNKKYFLPRHFSICWLGTVSFSSPFLFIRAKPPHQNPSKAKPTPPGHFRHSQASFAELGPARAAWPGETHSAPAADSLLTRLGSVLRSLTHARRTGPDETAKVEHSQLLESIPSRSAQHPPSPSAASTSRPAKSTCARRHPGSIKEEQLNVT